MPITEIHVHLPAHRRRALELQTDHAEAERAYDTHIGAYLEYLQQEAEKAGYRLSRDTTERDGVFSYLGDHEGKKAAHDWLQTVPDLWNWIP